MELAEVYRVAYEGPEVLLNGIIVSKDEDGYQYLLKDDDMEDGDINSTMAMFHTFKAYPLNISSLKNTLVSPHRGNVGKPGRLPYCPNLLKSFDHIIPNAAIELSIRAKDEFSLSFYLFGGIVKENIIFKYPSKSELNAPQTKSILSQDGHRYLEVFYAIFDNAVEARVKVTLANKSDPVYLSGVISARTSAIPYPAYSSLIFSKRPDVGENIEVGKSRRGRGKVIPLSRDVVAVPLGHQLILRFALKGCEDNRWPISKRVEADNEWTVDKTLTFDAIGQGTSTDYIRCSKGTFMVVVSWCIPEKAPRKPIEALRKAIGADPRQMIND